MFRSCPKPRPLSENTGPYRWPQNVVIDKHVRTLTSRYPCAWWLPPKSMLTGWLFDCVGVYCRSPNSSRLGPLNSGSPSRKSRPSRMVLISQMACPKNWSRMSSLSIAVKMILHLACMPGSSTFSLKTGLSVSSCTTVSCMKICFPRSSTMVIMRYGSETPVSQSDTGRSNAAKTCSLTGRLVMHRRFLYLYFSRAVLMTA
mmetsp:Transcript_22697/g.59251  ORF Transcript_22697/g.59251 Transcript_22697/m.59251 type:complete len:201 (+) Transcript_22697:1004-1606(+)